MSLINLFCAGRAALADWRQRRQAYNDLMALDDRALADIGIHRSQIHGLVEAALDADKSVRQEPVPDRIVAAAFGRGAPRLANGQRWMPPI
jgi:uncharacterized protein YjiS (DUF1127 family)